MVRLLSIKKELKNLIKQAIRYIYRNDLDKACFQRDAAYAGNKDLINRTRADKVDLADMQLLSKFNKRIKYLLCVIDLFSKYAFVVKLKDKKEVSIVNAFQSILNKSGRKPNKIWLDQGNEFYNHNFKKWLANNDISM